MQPIPDPYRELGVQRGATILQVKAAHRALAKRFHPDAPEGDSTRFLAIQEAYLLLSDPLRRRDWDARHAPGPVRAGAAPQGRATRPRAASGRWTREDAEANVRYGRAPSSGRSSTGRAATGGPGMAPGAGGGSAAGTGKPRAKGAGRAPRGTATPQGGSASGRGTAADKDPDRAEEAWSQSGRDPSSRSYTWSAERVPWWEDFTPHSRAEARDAGGRGRPNPDTSSGRGSRASKASGTSSGSKAASADAPTPEGKGASRSGGPEMDVYSRSSGAAWSMAARRYFRRGDADLPSRGSFVYRGTQVVTGAEARQVAQDEVRRRSAADDLMRPRPRTAAAPRQAFEHGSEPEAAPKHRPAPRQADSSANTRPGGPDSVGSTTSGAPTTMSERDRVPNAGATMPISRATPRAKVAVDSAAPAARNTDWQSSAGNVPAAGSASTGASAIIGAVAALLVTTPLVLIGGVAFLHPIDPLFVVVILVLAALSGGLAAAAWDARRGRGSPGR